MKIIDTHCDVLYKLQIAKRRKSKLPSFRSAPDLAANLERLKAGKVFVQFFAIFVDPSIPQSEKWAAACEQIDLFHHEVLALNPEMKHIRSWSDLTKLKAGEIGAVLALEGVEPIGSDLEKLHDLYEEGVLSVGLTWNKANLAADGALERRHGGLTSFGEDIVDLNNEHSVLTDLSHLSERSFWDVLNYAHYPIASHSNARAICDHPRNLSDIQLHALFSKKGLINLTFYPPFISTDYAEKTTKIEDLLRHIDYISSLAGKEYLGFGSDFDGIDLFVEDLAHAGEYEHLIDSLGLYYTDKEIRGFSSNNFLNFIKRVAGAAQ
ncbi:MAG TPA: dipeptidase [Pseudogracilibacillus sp.]|nr:dipeptidase [Pseudogracilibacillus sp.]